MSMARLWLGSAIFWLGFIIGADGCTLPRGEPVTLVGTLPDPVLADGRLVRLAGVLPKGTRLVVPLGAAVFHPTSRTPDRWGRVSGFLALGNGGLADSLNLALLQQGQGLALPGEWPPGCFTLALAAEMDARRAQRGLWAGPDPVLAATAVDRLRAAEGRFTLIEGTVRSVRQGRTQVFLNFGAFGSDRLSVTVPIAQLAAFQAAGLDVMRLRGEAVLMRGVVGPGPSMELSVTDALVRVRHP